MTLPTAPPPGPGPALHAMADQIDAIANSLEIFDGLAWTPAEPTWLDLAAYRVTFEDDFMDARKYIGNGDANLTTERWFAGAQGGPYGLANVGTAPRPDVYLQGGPSILEIRATATGDRTKQGGWISGHLQTVNRSGQGFAQLYGYFEARIQTPRSYMAWPAFWLKHRAKWLDASAINVELDAFEGYGITGGNRHHYTVHLGPGLGNVPPRKYHSRSTTHTVDPTAAFHQYGILVDAEWVTIYFDRVAVARHPMIPAFRQALYPQLTLSVNGHADELAHAAEVASPIRMLIDYVRVWAAVTH